MNRKGHNVYSEDDVKRIAAFIIQYQATLRMVEEFLGVPHASAHWLMCNKLIDIDMEAYTQVKKVIHTHRCTRVRVKPRRVGSNN